VIVCVFCICNVCTEDAIETLISRLVFIEVGRGHGHAVMISIVTRHHLQRHAIITVIPLMLGNPLE
jgi:hypothetical protein